MREFRNVKKIVIVNQYGECVFSTENTDTEYTVTFEYGEHLKEKPTPGFVYSPEPPGQLKSFGM